MLKADELQAWCQKNNITDLGRRKIEVIRNGQPVRTPSSRVGNVTGRYPSRKMKCTLAYESKTVELAAFHWMDHDDTYLEFYDQPTVMKLSYPGKNEKPVTALHTVDIFAIRTNGAGWEEWKPEKELERLAVAQPNRYQRDEHGQWCCPPGKTWAQKFGFTYRVRSSAELHPIYDRNLVFLDDFLREDCPQLADTTAAVLEELFTQKSVLTVEQLRDVLPAREIFLAIIFGIIYADLYASPLADGKYAFVYRNKMVADAYRIMSTNPYQPLPYKVSSVTVGVGISIVWDGRPWTLYNDGETTISLASSQGEWVHMAREDFFRLVEQGIIVEPATKTVTPALSVTDQGKNRLAMASPTDYATANQRYASLTRFWNGETPATIGVPLRTLHEWNGRWHKAERVDGLGYTGLLPQYLRSGNTKRKLSPEALAALAKFVDKYQQTHQPTKMSVWGKMHLYCQEQGIDAPSYKTFLQELNRVPIEQRTVKREGKRAAYRYKPQKAALEYPFLLYGTPPHGDRPFEIGHIDHFQIDAELRCSKTGVNLGKPWATVLVDAYSRRILAVYLTYDKPSYRSDMMVLRECVRRHQRLPQIIVVDRGSDFGGVYFETLLAVYEIEKRERPPAEPHFGSVIERYFNTTNTEFVHNVIGNTKVTKNPRQMTAAVNPKNLAVWTLERFYHRLCEYCYSVYDQTEHGGILETPRHAFERGLIESGERQFRHIAYDTSFIMLTLPTTVKGTAKVSLTNGVKVNYEWYWSEVFRQPSKVPEQTELAEEPTVRQKNDDEGTSIMQRDLAGLQVPIRYDPFDISRVFVWVNGDWHICRAAHYLALRNHTEVELQLITAELRRRRAIHEQNRPLSINRIAAFMNSVAAEEVAGMQRLCDSEARAILGMIDASYIFSLFQTDAPISNDEVIAPAAISFAELEPFGEY